MSELVIARARLKRDVPAVAFATLLVPKGTDQQVEASHRLLWSLYADHPDRQRDFLWRQTGAGEFLILSQRAPVDSHGLFELDHKPFAPTLRPGQRLAFNLRANATTRDSRGKRVDVVMHALYALPREERASQRARLTDETGTTWLRRQGTRTRFDLVPETLRINRHQQMRIPHGQKPIQFAVMDFEGELIVREPETFVAGLAVGFGKSKAFGCGLMLVRRT
jgi:CRISPR system Cascade subunit CasE